MILPQEIYISTKHKDKEFCNWFSSSNIFLNLMTVIPQMTVSYYRRKEMDKSVDVAARHNHFEDVLGPSSSSSASDGNYGLFCSLSIAVCCSFLRVPVYKSIVLL